MSEVLTPAQIIAAVMDDVQGLAKKDKNTAQGFQFRGIDAVMNAVGPALRKHGGFIVPVVDSADYVTVPSKNGGALNVVRLSVTYVVHSKDGGTTVGGSVFAEAFDSGDKATAKAMSVAYRTFLLQLLCLPTDEPDPDTFSYETAAPVVVDYTEQIAALATVEAAKKLYVTVKNAGGSADVLKEIESKAAELNG
jgi:hypothetical protein